MSHAFDPAPASSPHGHPAAEVRLARSGVACSQGGAIAKPSGAAPAPTTGIRPPLPKSTARVGCKAWRQARLDSLCAQSKLAEQALGLPARGSAKRMADRLGLAPTALSNMLRGAKNIGDCAARAIESRLGLEPGALDAPLFCSIGADDAELEAMSAALAAHRLALGVSR